MPRIVPLQLLKCLKVLLDENGGILSESEVKRIAGLMTKYSKKLVSKCIYVQILKCTKTELLGEFMGSGGWSLTHIWLNDAIRARNWPLVQEILELLLLCPVDVERLKSNSAPKLVKGLCKDADDEGVRILASKLVEQWLKVVTGDATATSTATPTTQMAPKTSELTPVTGPVNVASLKSDSIAKQTIKKTINSVEEDPLGATEPPIVGSFQPTLAQKKASESGLVLKCIVKDGKQVWARVENTPKNSAKTDTATATKDVAQQDEITNHEEKTQEDQDQVEEGSAKPVEAVQKSVGEVSSGTKTGNDTTDNKENEVSLKKKEIPADKDKSKEKEKEKEKNKSSSSSEKDKKSSSSSHKSSSSSSHKSSSSSSKSSSSGSSSNKLKSSHRSSTDSKSRDKDKEREKDKERSSNKERSSDKDKHRSSSSKSTSSSSSSSKDKDRHRDKSSSSSSSSIKKDKEKSTDTAVGQAEKDKETLSKLATPSIEKLGKIPRKSKDDAQEIKPTSITIPSKKASMSIEIRRDSEKAKTVKTYKSQFRSHGLTEEAPPPPSRKGLKKPNSAPVPGTAIPSTLTLKRSSPPPSSISSLSKDAPAEKKAKIEMAALAVPVVEKIGAIKLIPPKKSFIILCEFAVVWLLLIMRQLDNGWICHHQQQLVRG